MSNVEIIETEPEQGIVEYGYRNIKQYDMRAYYGTHLIASLWQDKDGDWHWTKRLYGLEEVVDVDTTYLEDKTTSGIIKEFAVMVWDWLNDEVSYLTNLMRDVDEAEMGCE